ncbi:LysR family transcriptional regulator [Plastoroseomonas hellenica]|uniref:LysR family transcriptional regulator n=1 Tax=Plastoroseomonas hellenica TaxID=2687306 RepID=UPI001BA60B17|nr:LysR family transcriptional regulator [Plastoroseomonas hellenica]MBR0646300.1 LysR family transcriptional regulator [Plastoroseomonas hellenica]
MSITLRQLRAMVAVARNGSLGRAAALLHLSQPALTVQIRELERALGVRLFDRGARGAEPTEAGRELAEAFGRILGDLDAVVAGARDVAALRSGLARVATLPSVGATVLPAVLARLRERSPRIRVAVRDAVAARVGALVKSGAAELGIAAIDPDPELEASLLFEDRMVAVLPAGHPLEKKRSVPLAALAAVPLVLGEESSVRSLFDRACAAEGLHVVPAYEATYISTLIGMVRAGLGVGVLPASAVDPLTEPAIRIRPITDPPIPRRVMLLRRAGRSLSPAAEAFVEALAADEPRRPAARGRASRARKTEPP